MSNPRIAMFVANHTRDLPGIVLTAFELCQRGATCYLIPFRAGLGELWALAPDFVLLPVFRPYQARHARRYLEAGIQFGLLDTEGVVWSSMEEYRQTIWDDPALSREAKCICVWGPAVADYMINDGVFGADQVSVTGCPRFDFYRDPLSSVYRETSDKLNVNKRPLVMINTNFTIANLADVSYPTVIDNLVSTYNFERTEVLRWYRNELRSIEGMVELANGLAKDFPELNVIFRPHPEEKLETYREKLAKFPNLVLTREGPVSPWILKSAAVIQRSCTTAIEANLAGSSAISPQWISPSNYYPVPESVSLKCSDYEALKNALQARLDGTLQLPDELRTNVDQIIEKWFYKMDGLAHKRVADAVMASFSDTTRVDRKKCLKHLYKLSDERGFSALPARLRYILGLSPDWSFRNAKALHRVELDDRFNVKAIEDLVNAIGIAKADVRQRPITVSRANDRNTYITESFRGRAVIMEAA